MVDEMDLLRELKATESVRPRAFEEARAVLRAAVAVERAAVAVDDAPETKTAARRRARWGTRRTAGFGIAGLVAVAAAAALAVSSISLDKPPAQAAGNPILVTLASNLAPLAKPSGDATLQIRNQSPTSKEIARNGIDLYTDDGTYYWGNDKAALRRHVSRREGGDDSFKRYIAVALYAVKGDIGTARARMAVANLAPGTNPGDAAAQAERTRIEKLKGAAEAEGRTYVPPKPRTPEQRKAITDNHIWAWSTDALIAAPENPQVRSGVLRIMATMPNVKVDKTTTAGRPTLTLTNSWPSLGGGYVESLVINADTGHPLAQVSRATGVQPRTTYYHSSRVTLADIEAGRF
jgi:hypothetical protein